LLGLTVAVAVNFALVWSIPLPEGLIAEGLRFALAGFFLVIILWEFARRPVRTAEFEELRKRRERLVENRRALAAEVEERRRRPRPSSATDIDASDTS
jgi:membrane protein implicated in regulation of membrane protease activity